MVKSFKKETKKKKNRYYLYYMIFKVFFNCFFFKFQFQNWNLGNLWSSSPSISVNNFKIHPKFLNLKEVQTQQYTTSPTQHTNTPTKNKNTYKWSEILRYSRTHCCGCTTGPKKKKKNLLWVQACKTQGSTVCGQPNLKRKKKKKVKVNQVSQSDAHSSKERETYWD